MGIAEYDFRMTVDPYHEMYGYPGYQNEKIVQHIAEIMCLLPKGTKFVGIEISRNHRHILLNHRAKFSHPAFDEETKINIRKAKVIHADNQSDGGVRVTSVIVGIDYITADGLNAFANCEEAD